MKPLKFPEEIKNFYLEQYDIINNYIEKWIDTSLIIRSSRDELYVLIAILSELSKLFGLSGSHRVGDLRMRFDPTSGKIYSEYVINTLDYLIGTKYILEFDFVINEYLDKKVITKQLYHDIMSLDYSDYTLSEFYYKINRKDLDLSKSIALNTANRVENLLTSIPAHEMKPWRKEELSFVFDMIELIHKSLLNLSDTRSSLHSSIYNNNHV